MRNFNKRHKQKTADRVKQIEIIKKIFEFKKNLTHKIFYSWLHIKNPKTFNSSKTCSGSISGLFGFYVSLRHIACKPRVYKNLPKELLTMTNNERCKFFRTKVAA